MLWADDEWQRVEVVVAAPGRRRRRSGLLGRGSARGRLPADRWRPRTVAPSPTGPGTPDSVAQAVLATVGFSTCSSWGFEDSIASRL